MEYQHDESLLLNYKFLASNLTSIPIIQNFKIMHYQHTLKFASKSYFHNFRVNHTQDQSLSVKSTILCKSSTSSKAQCFAL
nr:hypothetical protein [Enterococcus faecium]